VDVPISDEALVSSSSMPMSGGVGVYFTPVGWYPGCCQRSRQAPAACTHRGEGGRREGEGEGEGHNRLTQAQHRGVVLVPAS
jgi:hypothetical protein